MYLLDTNVISLTSPLAASVEPAVRDWIRDIADISFLSVISVAEITSGAARSKRVGPPAEPPDL